MGIKYLSWYLNSRRLYKQKISGSAATQRVVIDGASLVHYLYSVNFDWSLGGQYGAFTACLEKYIKTLHECGIYIVAVVFDSARGSMAKHDERIMRSVESITRFKRRFSTLEHASFINTINPANITTVRALPPLAMFVAMDFISKINTRVVVSRREADSLAARLAALENAAVISSDSDFLVLPYLEQGLIPIDSIQLDPKLGRAVFNVFEPLDIANHFKINVSYLPVFACACGNDYLSREEMVNNFYSRKIANLPREAFFEAIAMIIAAISRLFEKMPVSVLVLLFVKTQPNADTKWINRFECALKEYNIGCGIEKFDLEHCASNPYGLMNDPCDNCNFHPRGIFDDFNLPCVWLCSAFVRQAAYFKYLGDCKITEYTRTMDGQINGTDVYSSETNVCSSEIKESSLVLALQLMAVSRLVSVKELIAIAVAATRIDVQPANKVHQPPSAIRFVALVESFVISVSMLFSKRVETSLSMPLVYNNLHQLEKTTGSVRAAINKICPNNQDDVFAFIRRVLNANQEISLDDSKNFVLDI